LVVMPGIVDCHVHINEPGRTAWEGFETATKAAAAGGITTLVDMPLNCSPVTTTQKALQTKLDAVKGKLWVDCGFWGGIIPNNISELEPLLKAGVMGCKVFLIDSGIDEFPNVNESDLREAMPILKKYNVPLLVHAEMESVVGETNNYNNATSYQAFLDSRPKSLEDNAVKLVIKLCKENNCKTHIVHLSSADSLIAIQEAKNMGLPFTAETCPHYLTFNSEDIKDGDTRFKCCPPIREKSNNEKLWNGIKTGIIDFIVSDHSPCTANLKLMETGDIEKAWGGISGLQFSLSLIWTEAKKRNISIEELSKLMSLKTAEFIGLKDSKGKIAKGYDADFVIWNPEKTFIIDESIIHHKNKITPYLDKKLYGVVESTYLRGNKIYENGCFIDQPKGEFLLKNILATSHSKS
ncbi:MAG: allantoinase AllB, partial [Candidatus Sericytochromatia bacterium]|nr:allantoinase AllB [Candidatus Sericytochromatia bacterium]